MNSNEQRIREFAYQIWQSEGKPHGQAKRHWDMACKLAASDVQQSASTATPKAKAVSKKTVTTGQASTAVKPAKKPKAVEVTATATPAKAEAAKKTKAKTTPEKVDVKKTATLKKNKLIESQPT